MATLTTSQVTTGLLDVTQTINAERQALVGAQDRIKQAEAILDAMPVTYADLFDTINGYTGANETELNAMSQLDLLQPEFVDLRNKARDADTDLDAYDFTTQG